jgi:hypothetical protein
MNKIVGFISILLVIGSATALSQVIENNKPSFKERLVFGGDFGLQIGNYTQIEVSPIVGYRFTPRLTAGVGGTYKYYQEKGYWDTIYFNFNTSIYGGNIWTSYMLIRNLNDLLSYGGKTSISVLGEFEMLSLERKYFDSPDFPNKGRFLLPGFLIGGTIRQYIGQRSSFTITVLWNLNETARTPYTNPIIRMGFMF